MYGLSGSLERSWRNSTAYDIWLHPDLQSKVVSTGRENPHRNLPVVPVVTPMSLSNWIHILSVKCNDLWNLSRLSHSAHSAWEDYHDSGISCPVTRLQPVWCRNLQTLIKHLRSLIKPLKKTSAVPLMLNRGFSVFEYKGPQLACGSGALWTNMMVSNVAWKASKNVKLTCNRSNIASVVYLMCK